MSKDGVTPKISDIFNAKVNDTPQSNKRTSSTLSPAEGESNAKKHPTPCTVEKGMDNKTDLQLILQEFKSLKESVNNKVSSLEVAISKQEGKLFDELHKLEESISRNTNETTAEIKKSVERNSADILAVLTENKLLRKENNDLKDRISRIESAQLCNNVIISGIPE